MTLPAVPTASSPLPAGAARDSSGGERASAGPSLSCTAAAGQGGPPEPYYSQDGVTLYHGDMRDVLAALPAESVSACVTSPPFWGLRKYECEPTVWGGDPECDHRWGPGEERQDERYTGRRKWQHIANLTRSPPEQRVGQHSTLQGGKGTEIEAKAAQIKVRDLDPNAWGHPKVADTATCSLCGAWRGWYGLEPTVAMYVEHTIEVLRAIRRVLRKDGCCWWDLDDSRSGQGSGFGPGTNRGKRSGSPDHHGHLAPGIPDKSLCLIPQRVAIAAQEDGWIVRSQIIIPSWMPESAKDRPTDAYRTVLMLCKSKHYWYDAAAVRVAQSNETHEVDYSDWAGYNEARGQRGCLSNTEAPYQRQPDGLRNLGNVWDDIPPSAYPAAHFATFPVAEPERCIKASCPAEVCVKCGKARVRMLQKRGAVPDSGARAEQPEGPRRTSVHRDELRAGGSDHDNPWTTAETLGWTDCGCGAGFEPGLVLDPFIGTGTTAVAAVKLGRRCIGIDLSEDYLKQAVTRLTVGDAGVRRMVQAERAKAKQGILLGVETMESL